LRVRLWRTLVILAAVAILFVVATARLFVWPARGAPPHADAIVLFNGQGDRIDEAFALAYAHVAPNLLISRGSRDATNSCSPPIPGVAVTCFDPDPVTTQGEAEFAGRMATTHHWRSVVLVTSRPQDTRARLRMGQCFGGRIYVATAPLPRRQWPKAIAYEWGAMAKALVIGRSC
jgi:uncharacterized SAM-binding protein YcdF (DUF218 family)